MLPLAVCYRLQ